MADEDDDGIPTPSGEAKKGSDLDQMAAQLATISGELDTLKKNAGAAAANNPPAAPAVPDKEALKKEFWKNPLEIVAQISQMAAGQAVTQMQAANAPTLMQTAKDQARAADTETFDKYEAEILSRVQQVHPSQQTNVEVWKTAFSLVKGTHLDEIIESRKEKAAARTSTDRGDGPVSPSRKAAPAPKAEALTEDEEVFCTKFQISKEQLISGKARYANQHDGKADKPSIFDGAITFDSRFPRARPTAK